MADHNRTVPASESYWDEALDRDIQQLGAGQGEHFVTLERIRELRVAHDMNLQIGHSEAARAAAGCAGMLARTTLENLHRLLTAKEAAAITGYTERHLRALHDDGQLPGLLEGNQRRFRLGDIRRYRQQDPPAQSEIETMPRSTLVESTPEADAKRRIQRA